MVLYSSASGKGLWLLVLMMWQNSFTETKETKGYFALQMRVQYFIVGKSSGRCLK